MKDKKILKSVDIFSLIVGTVISSGLFIVPSIAYSKIGSGILIAYFLTGLFMIPTLLTKMELVTALPKAGGSYFFIDRAMGSRMGLFAGLSIWITTTLKATYSLLGIEFVIENLFPEIPYFQLTLYIVAIIIFFTVLNLISIKIASFFQNILTFVLIGSIIFYLFFVFKGHKTDTFIFNITNQDYKIGDILATISIIFISYGGLTKITSVSEEVDDPNRLVFMTFFSLFIIQLIYLLMIFFILGVSKNNEFLYSNVPFIDVINYLNISTTDKNISFFLIIIASLTGFITTANSGLVSASRVPFAMSKDRLIPSIFSSLNNQKTGSSVYSLIVTSFLMLVTVLFLDFVAITKMASALMILLFIFDDISIIIIHYSKISNYKPKFKSPWFPFFEIVGISWYVLLLTYTDYIVALYIAIFFILCLVLYEIYSKSKVSRHSALALLYKKILDIEMEDDEKKELNLENEFLTILMDRENIVEDEFDKIIRSCLVFDFKETQSLEQSLNIISHSLSEKWNIDKDSLAKDLLERELESPTVFVEGVAIPHTLAKNMENPDYQRKYDIVLIRNKYGINWGDKIVYTAFVLVREKEERDFHLRSLMSFAQILQDENFIKNWNSAKSETDLKTAILISKRNRKSV